MIRKIKFMLAFICLKFKSRIQTKGFVKIDPGVEIILEKNAKLIFGKNVFMRKGIVLAVYSGATVEFGNNVFIAHGVTIAAKQNILIEDNTMIAEYVSIRDHDHDSADLKKDLCRPVHIGKKVWLAAKATIIKGVTIGDNAVIGANAVVTKSVPANNVAVGVPAKCLKK